MRARELKEIKEAIVEGERLIGEKVLTTEQFENIKAVLKLQERVMLKRMNKWQRLLKKLQSNNITNITFRFPSIAYY